MSTNFYLITIIFLYFIKLTNELNLIPDVLAPLQMPSPTNSANGAQIVFRFSFPSQTDGPFIQNSPGLHYKQFIGVSFPEILGDLDLTFDQGGTKYGCALTDGDYAYSLTPVPPILSP